MDWGALGAALLVGLGVFLCLFAAYKYRQHIFKQAATKKQEREWKKRKEEAKR